jgi:hypothetical protein
MLMSLVLVAQGSTSSVMDTPWDMLRVGYVYAAFNYRLQEVVVHPAVACSTYSPA